MAILPPADEVRALQDIAAAARLLQLPATLWDAFTGESRSRSSGTSCLTCPCCSTCRRPSSAGGTWTFCSRSRTCGADAVSLKVSLVLPQDSSREEQLRTL